jgi:hypothetical protein
MVVAAMKTHYKYAPLFVSAPMTLITLAYEHRTYTDCIAVRTLFRSLAHCT